MGFFVGLLVLKEVKMLQSLVKLHNVKLQMWDAIQEANANKIKFSRIAIIRGVVYRLDV